VTTSIDVSPDESKVGPLDRARRLARYLRLKPYETDTAEGRAAERYRRAAWSTIAALIARAIAIVSTLATVPLAIGYLGPERYGLWVTISSVTAMLTFADFGLGNGLMNLVADASGHGDRAAAHRAVSSAFYMLSALSASAVVLFIFLYGRIAWADALNVTSLTAAAEAGPSVAVFFACLALSLPLGLVQRIQLGYQENYISSLWAALGNLLALAGLIAAIHVGAGLPWLVLALAGAPVASTALNGVLLFTKRHPDLRPRLRLASRATSVRLMRVGFLFFMLQLAGAIAYQSDVVVAARVVGPDAAAEYAVLLRMFFLVPTLITMVLIPLWPAYGEAIARGDIGWVRTTLKRSLGLSTLVSGSVALGLLVLGDTLLKIWIGPLFHPSFALLLGMALWSTVYTAFNSIAMLLNGATVIAFQVVVATVMAIASILASVQLGTRIGVAGIIWGTLLAYVFLSALPISLYVPRLLRRLDAQHSAPFLAA
jgi:O-antigen/teichoic acid export membrane protein